MPGVDMAVVDALRDKLRTQAVALNSATRMGQPLREGRLIGPVRQRLSIPGGCCSFDLPGLHIWLHLEDALYPQVSGHNKSR
nr:DNA gyrase inhibitor YacG [Candidatus Pantoea persica]